MFIINNYRKKQANNSSGSQQVNDCYVVQITEAHNVSSLGVNALTNCTLRI